MHAQAAAVSAEMLDREQRRLWRVQPVAPLDDHRALIEKVLQAEVEELGIGPEAVEVDVGELNAPWVHAHQLKGGAGDVRRRSGAPGNAADEGRLARAEVAFEQK